MSRIRQRNHGPSDGLATEQRRQVREIAKGIFDRDGHTVPRHLLNRGEVSPFDGSINTGLSALKLAEEVLSDEVLFPLNARPSHADGHGLPANLRTLPLGPGGADPVKVRRENLLPDLVESANVKSLSPSKLERRLNRDEVPKINDLEGDNLDGAKLQNNSVASDKVAGLAANKINGSINWNQSGAPDYLQTYEKLRKKLTSDGFRRK